MTAKRGRQDAVKPNIVHLEDIEAVFRKPGGKVYNVTSASGVYDDKAKDVDLEGQVVISEATTFTARMEKAYVQIETKAMTSDVPVTVDMVGGGTIAANGMQITDDGTKILFLNGVKARFGAETGKGDQTHDFTADFSGGRPGPGRFRFGGPGAGEHQLGSASNRYRSGSDGNGGRREEGDLQGQRECQARQGDAQERGTRGLTMPT